MLDSINQILTNECRLDRNRILLVGVSGGPDSLCLLDALYRLGYKIHVAHVNHKLRQEAAEELLMVRQVALQRGLPFSSVEVDVLGYADQVGMTIEEAGRALRYQFLFAQAQQVGAQAVVVGHNADDQVETVLMHILRGSGMAGLRGMTLRALPNPWSQQIPLIRPLLHTWRSDIEAYCAKNGLQPSQDLSNLDPNYMRNRIRLELIPLLEKYQPAVRGRLLNLARLVGDEDDQLAQLLEKAWQSCLLDQGERYVRLSLAELRRHPLAIQRRIVRRVAGMLRPGLTDVTFDDIERAVLFTQLPPQTRQLDWMSGLRLLIEGESLWLAGWEAELPVADWLQLPDGQQLVLSVPGQIGLSGGWWLRAELGNLDAEDMLRVIANNDPFQVWLDAETLAGTLLLRSRKAGDLFEPLGMNGQLLSLNDWMIKHKLPRRARALWPLLCSEENIVWIPGFQPAHSARIRRGTRQVVHLHLSKA